jgi:DNA-binding transcriptional LysR family regulator
LDLQKLRLAMNWDRVRIFLAVARSGQLLAAGKQLGINQATVGRQLTMLEEELCTQLVKRHVGGCALTDAGQVLLRSAERTEAEFRKAESELTGEVTGLVGTVRVGAPDGLGNFFLSRHLAAFAVKHPGLVIQLAPLPQHFSLSRGDADLAIRLECPHQGRSIVHKLTDYSISVYASESYVACHGPIRSMDELDRHPFVTNIEEYIYSTALDYARALAIGFSNRFECCSVAGQVEAIRGGGGIGILHDYVARSFSDLRRIIPSVALVRSYWMVSHRDNLPRVAAVKRFITDLVRSNRAQLLNPDTMTDGLKHDSGQHAAS